MDPSTQRLFELENEDVTLILTPTRNLSELEFDQAYREMERVIEFLEEEDELAEDIPVEYAVVRNVVIDFSNTDYFGSTTLGLFIKLWKKVTAENGRMAICCLSPLEKKVLEDTQFLNLWPVYSSRDEAIRKVNNAA